MAKIVFFTRQRQASENWAKRVGAWPRSEYWSVSATCLLASSMHNHFAASRFPLLITSMCSLSVSSLRKQPPVVSLLRSSNSFRDRRDHVLISRKRCRAMTAEVELLRSQATSHLYRGCPRRRRLPPRCPPRLQAQHQRRSSRRGGAWSDHSCCGRFVISIEEAL